MKRGVRGRCIVEWFDDGYVALVGCDYLPDG